ncbi:DUF397 domain-containing protein [Dactylosporangium sp. CA-139114]|uniref:DUF397 domain-containing protein n=1 Tax=Dactylosporangium sp. CA-139114 TaxID=3239931 RepID=UPI003D98C015
MTTTAAYTGWRKSTYSDDGNCVEVGHSDSGSIGVRDSKNPFGPILDFDQDSWAAFTRHIRTGRLDR